MTGSKNRRPPLEKMKKDNPFKVPEGYFESFSARLNDRIHEKSRIILPAKKAFAWKPYLAAAILLIVALVTGNYMFNHSGQRAAERLRTEISQVVEQELYSISEETIIEVMESESPLLPVNPSGNADEMIDYLLNENILEDELMNTL